MSPTLHIHLLGPFLLLAGDDPVTGVNTPRLRALLAYLVLGRQTSHLRPALAFLLWPDSSEAQAQTNLRKLVHELRSALPQADAFLRIDSRALQWRTDAPYTLDVADFEGAVAQAETAERADAPADQGAALQQAVAAYRGDLLPGVYADWIFPERERLRRCFLAALEQLTLLLESARLRERHPLRAALAGRGSTARGHLPLSHAPAPPQRGPRRCPAHLPYLCDSVPTRTRGGTECRYPASL